MAKSIWSLIRIMQFLKDKDVNFSKKLLFLVPVLYLLFPFDLIGDFFPLAGQLDDIAVFVLMWPILRGLLSNYDNLRGGGQSRKKYKDAIDIEEDDYDVH